MARQAEADRERRARVIDADAELQASKVPAEAAREMSETPAALQLRLLQTVVGGGRGEELHPGAALPGGAVAVPGAG